MAGDQASRLRRKKMSYKEILMHFLKDYLSDTGVENYLPAMSDEDLKDSISDKVVERFRIMLKKAPF
jgi:hypothetical protein